jgi:flagellar biosynthetic protein FlhB
VADSEERTEEPTARRRDQAREQGQVARSREIDSAVMVLTSLAVGLWAAPRIIAQQRDGIGAWLALAGTFELSQESLPLVLGQAVTEIVSATLPVVVCLMIGGLVAQLAQAGFNPRPTRLLPKLGRLSIASGLQRIFSTHGVVNLLKSILKLAIVGTVAYRVVRRSGEGAEELVALPIWEQIAFIGAASRDVILWVGVALLVLAAFDYAYEYYRTEQKLKMSRQEVKDEQRAAEGDPKVRRRFRRAHEQLTRNRMLAEVPTADVVITNPIHLAVALRYSADTMRAPRVIAKGAGELAERIKAAARSAGVPIVERRALARALFRTVKLGQEIPGALYRAVAEVLAYIYSLERARAAATHEAT